MSDGLEPKGVLPTWKQAAVRAVLVERGCSTTCTRCTSTQQMLMFPRATYIEMQALHEAITGVNEQRIPAILLLCANCGWTSMHALGMLGLGELLNQTEPPPVEPGSPTPAEDGEKP